MEDIAFYVDEARRSRGRWSSSRLDRGASQFRSPRAGEPVIGVDLSEGMLGVARALAEEQGVGDACRPSGRRPARASRRRARAARDLPVPLAAPHAGRGGEAEGSAGGPRAPRARRHGSSSTSSRRAPRTSPRRTGSGSSASPASSSGPTGTRDEDAEAVGALGRAAASMELHWLSAIEWRRLIDEAGFEVGGALRLVRPPAVPGRRGHDLGLPQPARRGRPAVQQLEWPRCPGC